MVARDMSRFGTKHGCYKCGTKFYDLNKPVPLCPKCGADQTDAPVRKVGAAAAQPIEEDIEEEVTPRRTDDDIFGDDVGDDDDIELDDGELDLDDGDDGDLDDGDDDDY